MSNDDNKNNITDRFEKEKQSSFVSVIVDAFEKFVGIFKKAGLGSVTFILVLFMLTYSFILNPVNINEVVKHALQREKKIELEQQKKSIMQRMEADRLIVSIMNTVIEDFNVNRAMLLETHNGSQNISGIEYLFASATMEVINTRNIDNEDVYDLDYQADTFQRQHLSNLFGSVVWNRLRHEPYIYFSNLEKYHRTSYRFVNRFKEIGAESLMIIPFCSNNIPVLLLVFTSKNPEIEAQKIYDYVERFRDQIEKNLMQI